MGILVRRANEQKRTSDILPVIKAIQEEDNTSLRQIAATLNERSILAPMVLEVVREYGSQCAGFEGCQSDSQERMVDQDHREGEQIQMFHPCPMKPSKLQDSL